MVKKYKLFTADSNNQSGGNFPPVPMPTYPLINPLSGQFQMVNPVLPNMNSSFNVYPPPLALGPKINLFPQNKLVTNDCQPKLPCGNKVLITNNCPNKKCDLSLLDLLTNSNKANRVLSPFSDGLPSLEFFK
ncbi:hypothetical protein Catovirus_2_81 [Catovirus CTV1]|uniref:Uncharacterized protein n=1 Tax=Catovirus CTV1 TaxID=1977631 RepID=A0A1V0SBQ2_9VIRU|nr:hypothetical protein Catovirus_2_81 [Catovirus CTV1]